MTLVQSSLSRNLKEKLNLKFSLQDSCAVRVQNLRRLLGKLKFNTKIIETVHCDYLLDSLNVCCLFQ